MSVINLGPLDWRIPIVTTEGRPTQEFQRRWANQTVNNSQIGGISLGAGPPTAINPTDGAQYADTSTNPYTLYIANGGTWALAGSSSGSPTATAGDVAIPGSASTFMRSDAAPAVQKGSATQFGIVKVDGTTITEVGGVISSIGGGGGGMRYNYLGAFNSASGTAFATKGVPFTALADFSLVSITVRCTLIAGATYHARLYEISGTTTASTITAVIDDGVAFIAPAAATLPLIRLDFTSSVNLVRGKTYCLAVSRVDSTGTYALPIGSTAGDAPLTTDFPLARLEARVQIAATTPIVSTALAGLASNGTFDIGIIGIATDIT